MPLIGYLVGNTFAKKIQAYDHWIAFILLLYIGGKMIVDAIKEWKEKDIVDEMDPPIDYKELTLMAIATSIDALAVGITFAFLKINIIKPVIIIGLLTFSLSFLGVFIGNKFGARFKDKAQILGGVILILIGIKILIEHLT